ncbi:hypothetical protein QFC21_005675 [Naganishia friedmannii]|uniref:Uncharacterized protein n=1 Tax=Naganishia friedmannii TaxID=89922 RepID=A0ACC2V8K7_9TREE|nr:hypothetical protein QFC21_005675 [Naganishia friedmannii]
MAPKKIILDTDPGVDDVLAVLLALASPELETVAITITFGNTHAPTAYNNLLKIYASLARELVHDADSLKRFPGLAAAGTGRGGSEGKKTVLALGADGPVGGEKSVAAYFHGTDGLSNISETHPHFDAPQLPAEGAAHEHLELSKKHASEVILDQLRENERGSVTIVALGPLSNLALALAADPETFARVGQVIWMGGALDVPGNTSPVAEFNCFADPYAAYQVMEGVKRGLFRLVMAPLDITTPHTIPFRQLIHTADVNGNGNGDAAATRGKGRGKGEELTPLREFTSAMLVRVRGLMQSFGLPDEMEMHDPVAVWYAIENPTMTTTTAGAEGRGWKTVPRVFAVERTGELTRGMCVVDRRYVSRPPSRPLGFQAVAYPPPVLFCSMGRGTDEEDALRTKSSISSGKNEDGSAATGKSSRTGAPEVIVGTPGKKVLETLLLGRVFGA